MLNNTSDITKESEEQILENIDNPQDLKKLNYKQKEKLASEIRNKLIKTVSKTGGHLASNLGVTELTIALHSVFDTPQDKIVWDVGHQTYVHKILTGRKDKLETLRSLNGIAGFPKSKESEYDSFDTGHSSTSISVALGMAKARDINKEDNNIIVVIGDGALTGGMALEALDDAGNSKTKLIIVLNDNEMSISKNVGGISRFLTRIRTKKFYKKSNNFIRKILEKLPIVGPFVIKTARKIKYSIKQLMIPNMFFEDLGFKYLGPVDGNDIERVEWILELAKKEKEPVLVHIITKKGKGYKPAEENPDEFHATSSFNIETGESLKEKKKDYSQVMGERLVSLAQKDEKIVAITAAMADGTGLKKFKEIYPERFFDVGIAEQHALGFAAGLAKSGLKPVIPIYSSFYQRAYDQVIHDICLQQLPVVLCVDRAGIVGNDGETHQGVFDLSFFNIVPNLTIMAPKDFEELEKMLEYAVNLNAPVVIRYPRGGESQEIKFDKHEEIKHGKAEIIKEGKDISIIAIGKMVAKAESIAKELEKQGKSVEIINARFLKPFDTEKMLETIQKTKNVITIEDGTIIGGLATKVKELIVENNLQDIKIKCYAYPDKFIEHGNVEQLEEKYLFATK